MSLERINYSLAGDSSLELHVYLDRNEKSWFKAKEIAIFMGYGDADRDIQKHVSAYNQLAWRDISSDDAFWESSTVFVNGSGLQQLMLRSKSPGKLQMCFRQFTKRARTLPIPRTI